MRFKGMEMPTMQAALERAHDPEFKLLAVKK